MSIFSTRELATGFWGGILLITMGIVIAKNPKTRESFLAVLKISFDQKLRKLWEIYLLYIGIITFCFSRLWIWENVYLKDIIIWTIFSGLTICMNAIAGEADEKYVLKVLKDDIRFTLVTEFLLSTFTFSLLTELAIVPIVTFIVMLDTIAENKSEMISVHKFLQGVLALIGVYVVIQTALVGIREYQELNVRNTLVSFFIPIVYLLLVTPLEYAFELYSKYETLFTRMSFKEAKDKNIQRKRRIRILKACGGSVRKIMLFQKKYVPQMYVSMSEAEFDLLMERFDENN